MSAYKEKMMAEKRIAELEIEIERTNRKLETLMAELVEQKMFFEDAEQGIKWEAQNDR